MKKFFLVALLAVTFLAFLSTPAFFNNGSAGAVDIFSRCQNDPDVDAQDKMACADCSSAAKDTDVCNSVNAQEGNTDEKGNYNNNNPIVNIIKAAINVLSLIIGAAAIIGVIVSGLRMVASGGDSNAVASARSGLMYSLIGIAVVLLAQSLVVFVLSKVQ
ncbi:MAG: pilin [Candidatus Saccharimonadales bacterium]